MSTTFDTIIVGAGLAGLTAATHIAQAGKRPLVLERNGHVGGRARTEDLNGWRFNHGGHALYNDGLGHVLLRKLGVEPDGEQPPLVGGQLALNGGTTPLPLDAKGIAKTKALSPVGKLQFAKLMATLGRLDPSAFATTTADEWLAGYRPDVQALAKAVVRLSTYACATELMSADAAISQLAGAQAGVLYLHDGWAALCAQLAQAATHAGAVIETGAAAKTITPTASGYSLRGERSDYRAKCVIVAAGGPAFTARLLEIDEASFGDVGPAPEAAALDLALDAMPSKHGFILGVDTPTYFSVHSPPARLAPEGKVAAVAMRYLHPNDDGSADEHRASLEAIAELAGACTATHSRFLRRMTVTHGLPIASAGGMAGRPPITVADRPGAFIAGDWVGPRGLLADAAIASGFDAASATLA